jgi:hypothetical protein
VPIRSGLARGHRAHPLAAMVPAGSAPRGQSLLRRAAEEATMRA